MAGIPVMTVAQVAFFVCMILVPLFVWYVREKGDAWVINAVVSTVAFPFWAYASAPPPLPTTGTATSPPSRW